MAAPKRTDLRLAPAEMAEVRAALAAARGKKRIEIIFSSRDPKAVVRALPADDLYLIIREVGLADAEALVPLASTSQFRHFLDLDAWTGDHFNPARALPWLWAARSGAIEDDQAAARWAAKLAGIDPEIIHLLLRATVRVHDLEKDPDPEFEFGHFERTPDQKSVVEFLVEGEEYASVKGLLDDLMAEDPFLATRLLFAISWDLPSELEETALRWREGRLADLGHPPLEEALSWFARPPRKSATGARAGIPARPPGFLLAELARSSLLDRAVAALGDHERAAVEGQVVAAANAVLVADRVDPGDPERVREALATARAYLEFGLEKLAGMEVEAAAEVLATAPLKRIFQEGFGRVLELGWRAKRLHERTQSLPEIQLGSPLDELVAALASPRPRYFPGIEAPREDWGTVRAAAFEARPFATSDELTRTASALDEAESRLGTEGGQRP